jgi:hypothetical protein
MPLRSLAAADIFISYLRSDARTYAAGLADELTKRGFSIWQQTRFHSLRMCYRRATSNVEEQMKEGGELCASLR